MAARDPVRISSLDASDWNAVDGVVVENFLWFATAAAAVSTTDTTLTDTRAVWITDEWAGVVVSAGGKTMSVTSNTGTVLTGASWSGGGNPGNNVSYKLDKGLADNLTVNVVKQGKAPDDIIKIWYDLDPDGLSTSDTFTFNIQGLHNYVTGTVLPYNAATTVLTGNKLTYTAATGDNTTTVTSGFRTDLNDLGDPGTGHSVSFAIRMVEDGEINGDCQLAEVDADLTEAAAFVAEEAWMPRPQRPDEPIVTVW